VTRRRYWFHVITLLRIRALVRLGQWFYDIKQNELGFRCYMRAHRILKEW